MTDVNMCVKSYFDQCLTQGDDLMSIIDRFKSPLLPRDVSNCGDEPEIRRYAQLISTKYLKQQYFNQPISSDDPLVH